jgi:hypothetical protein
LTWEYGRKKKSLHAIKFIGEPWTFSIQLYVLNRSIQGQNLLFSRCRILKWSNFGNFLYQIFIGKLSETIQNFAWFSEAFRVRTLSENYLIFKRFFWQKSNKYRKVFIYFVSEKHPILVRKRRRLFGKCSHRNRIRQKSIRHILSRD